MTLENVGVMLHWNQHRWNSFLFEQSMSKCSNFSMQDTKYCKIVVWHILTFIWLFHRRLLVKPVANTESPKFLQKEKQISQSPQTLQSLLRHTANVAWFSNFTLPAYLVIFHSCTVMPNRANQSVSQTVSHKPSLAYRVLQPLIESSVVAVLSHLHE